MRDGQAQARARLAAAPPATAALEGQEDALHVLRRDADAGVDHLETQHLAARVQAQRDLATLGEAHRVAAQVEQDLPQAPGIGLHPGGHAAAGLQAEVQAFGFGLRLHHAHHLVEEVVQGQRGGVQAQATGFDAGQVEQAVDEADEVLAAALDGRQRAPPDAIGGLVLEQDLRVAHDAVERGAQLVRHAGHVARLGLVRGLGQLLGALQRGVGAAVGVDFLLQQLVLAVGVVLRHAAALGGQHDPPRTHGGGQQQQGIGFDEGPVEHRGRPMALLVIDGAQHEGQQGRHRQEDDEVVPDTEVDAP